MGRNATSCPGQRVSPIPRPASTSRGSGASRRRNCRSRATRAVEIMNAIHSGEIKGLLSICFNPLVSLPDANFTREALEKLEFFGVIDFFLSETAQHADVVLAGSLQEEEEGVGCSAEARVIHIQKARRPAGQCAHAIPTSSAIWRAAWARAVFPVQRIPRDFRGIARGIARRRRRLLRHHLREDRPADGRLLALSHRSTIPARRVCSKTAVSIHPDGKAHFIVTAWRESGDPVDDGFPIYLTTGRVVSQYLSGTQTRRIGALVDQYPEPRVEIHPRLAEQHGISDGDWVTVTTRRGAITLAGDGRATRFGPTRCSFPTTGLAARSANR